MMAGADYYDCDTCGAGKMFYDANIDWEHYGERIGQIRVICNVCYEKDVRIETTERIKKGVNEFVHNSTREGMK